MSSDTNRPLTPTITQVQAELAKFLQDFDTVKFLINESDEQPSTSATDSRRSIYDNVPSTQESTVSSDTHPSIPQLQVTKATPEKIPQSQPSTSDGVYPHYSSPRPHHPQEDAGNEPWTCDKHSSGTFPRLGSRNQSTKPTVRCSTCKELLFSKENVVYYPAFCTLGHHNKQGESESSSNGLHSIEDGVWRSTGNNHHSHVRFKLEDSSDKMPLRWGSSRIVPMRTNMGVRKKPFCPSSLVVAIVLFIVGVCLLGIGVAVTCASLLSVIQDDVKDSPTGCKMQAYQAHMIVNWFYNISCSAQFNDTLADVSSTNFVRASKVYEALLDPVFRRGGNRQYFDFTKVDRVWCLAENENDVFISFKIFWKDPDHIPEPRLVLQDFLLSIRKLDQEKYNISTYSITIEGYKLSKN